MTINLMTALSVRAEARRVGLRVPRDVSIVTFDDHIVADHLDPPLTGIRLPMDEMGGTAAQMLLAAIDGAPMRHLVVPTPPRIVRRGSTAPPPRAPPRTDRPAGPQSAS